MKLSNSTLGIIKQGVQNKNVNIAIKSYGVAALRKLSTVLAAEPHKRNLWSWKQIQKRRTGILNSEHIGAFKLGKRDKEASRKPELN